MSEWLEDLVSSLVEFCATMNARCKYEETKYRALVLGEDLNVKVLC